MSVGSVGVISDLTLLLRLGLETRDLANLLPLKPEALEVIIRESLSARPLLVQSEPLQLRVGQELQTSSAAIKVYSCEPSQLRTFFGELATPPETFLLRDF